MWFAFAFLVGALRAPPLDRRQLLGLGAALAPAAGMAHVGPASTTSVGRGGWTIDVPALYYIPKGSRPKTGAYDDTLLVAADYTSGRTAAVTGVKCGTLLFESGDMVSTQLPDPRSLAELGKPRAVAALLARRRDGDATGSQPSRTSVLSASRSAGGDELRFTLLQLGSTDTGAAVASPSARVVQARSLFLPAERAGGSSYVLTAWASSEQRAVPCSAVPCEGTGGAGALDYSCPPPVCELDGADGRELAPDPADVAVVESLRLGE